MKKIMFSDKYGLTQAVLEGRKTMTRRIIPEMLDRKGIVTTVMDDDRKIKSYAYVGEPNWEMDGVAEWMRLVPRYDVGEVVAIAQRYSDMNRITFPVFVSEKGVFMKTENSSGWNNKMYVQADLMPHRIRITDIRVERLQDITEEDCLREGIEKGGDVYSFNDYEGYKTPQLAFKALIDKISGKGTWEINPWVFIYEFELVK